MDTASNKANMDFLFISFFLFYFSYFRTIVCTKKATAYSDVDTVVKYKETEKRLQLKEGEIKDIMQY